MRKTKIATFGVIAAAMIVVPATPAFAYDVQPGDTLSEVAERHGTTWQELAAANGLSDPDRIFPGQYLDLGEGGAPRPVPKVTTPPPQQQAPQSESQTSQAPKQSSQVPQQTSQAPQSSPEKQSPAAAPAGGAAAPAGGGAKAEIIRRESSGNPRAQNGRYHGLFQTDQAWGRGTVAEQHAGAERYVRERYGSWDAALRFHNRHGWY